MLCEAPYLGITIDPAGNINMCCNTMDREQFGTKITDIDNLEEFFQSKQYDKLRKQMSTVGMEGIKNCEVCWIVNQGLEAEITNYHRRAEYVAQGGIPDFSAPDSSKKFSIKDFKIVSKNKPTKSQLKDLEQSITDFEKTGGKKEWYNNVGVNTPMLEADKWEMGKEKFEETIQEARDFIREKREIVEKAEQQLTGAQ